MNIAAAGVQPKNTNFMAIAAAHSIVSLPLSYLNNG
jgi:hypothetical protein